MTARLNLDRVLPYVAPVMRRGLRTHKARRRAQFQALSPSPGRVVFLGDSIVEGGMWEEWLPTLPTSNRGISGDTVGEVMARLDVSIASPRAIALMIGTNDLHGLGHSSDPQSIASQVRELVAALQDRAAGAPIILHSVTPRSSLFAERIRELNTRYRTIAEESGTSFVDLWPAFAETRGAIRSEFTLDGIHLSPAGYREWAAILRPVLDHALG